MSDLQILLIILGAFIIAGVVVYNWLQERKLRNQVSNEFIVPQKDVLAEDFYIDTDAFVEKELAEVPHEFKRPIFEELTQPAVQAEKAAEKIIATTIADIEINNAVNNDSLIEESLIHESLPKLKLSETAESGFTEGHSTALSSEDTAADVQASSNTVFKKNTATQNDIENSLPQLPTGVHAQIDLTAILYANKLISYKALCDMAASIDDIKLPMMIYGLDSVIKWHLVQSKHVTPHALAPANAESTSEISFKQAACSLQLADRGGPVAKNLLNKFQYAIENMGLELNAHVEWQGSGDVLQRAVELDKFCMEVDQLINVHVAQGDMPIHGTKFRGLAEVNGMTLNEDGKFHYYTNNNANNSHAISTDTNSLTQHKLPLFCALEANNQAFTADNLRSSVLKAITFQLEIPKAANCELAFNQMIAVAQKLSTSLNARLVDDNQKPLGDLQIEKIRQQLKIIHATMVARGVMPGSPASMRLFN